MDHTTEEDTFRCLNNKKTKKLLISILQHKGVQLRGPVPAREDILSIIKKYSNIFSLRKNYWFSRMWHNPKPIILHNMSGNRTVV